jgi:ankyrin repeat protein
VSSSKLSKNWAIPALLKGSHLLLLLLSILLVRAQPLCAAQSRSSDLELFHAVIKGDMGAVRVLLDNGANIDAQDERGDTPIMVAVGNHNIAMLKLLLEKGADVSARNNYEESALTEAAESFDSEMLQVILSSNPDNKEKNAALFQAAESGAVVIQVADAPTTQTGRMATPQPLLRSCLG